MQQREREKKTATWPRFPAMLTASREWNPRGVGCRRTARNVRKREYRARAEREAPGKSESEARGAGRVRLFCSLRCGGRLDALYVRALPGFFEVYWWCYNFYLWKCGEEGLVKVEFYVL